MLTLELVHALCVYVHVIVLTLERNRREEQRQREELKVKLKLTDPPEVEHKEEDDSVLSWKPVQEATPTPPTYSILLYTDDKKEGKDIYK